MNIESLNNTTWDVLISGTGLRESLLAAALSRAGKKVLHIDKNQFYGDEYAALSLDELEALAKDERWRLQSFDFKLHQPSSGPKLAKSRSYTLNLAPGLLYTTSPILSLLVSSKLHEAFEFLKVGSWFIYDGTRSDKLMLVPSSREDVFNDKSLDARTKRVVVRALKSIIGLEGTPSASNRPTEGRSLQDHLSQPPLSLQSNIIAAFTSLTLCPEPPAEIPFTDAEVKIRKYFGAAGRFGPGFSAVIGRYGSGSELVQVLCRSAAVTGNAVYVLENGIANIQADVLRPVPTSEMASDMTSNEAPVNGFEVDLQSGDTVWTKCIVGTALQIPDSSQSQSDTRTPGNEYHWYSIYIVSSPLSKIFQTNEPPVAAGTVVYFPSGSIGEETNRNKNPLYIFGHSSETGECPEGQSILYVSTKAREPSANEHLDLAVASLLQSVTNEDGSIGEILMSAKYKVPIASGNQAFVNKRDGLFILSELAPGIEIPDETVVQVIDLYEALTGTRDGFMEKTDAEQVNNAATED